MSGTGTGSLIPLPSRERGFCRLVCLVVVPGRPRPVVSRLRGNDGVACVAMTGISDELCGVCLVKNDR